MNKKTKKIAYIGIYIALAVVFNYLKEMLPFLTMPQGGSVDISLIPLVIGAIHLGFFDGILLGVLFWLITTILGMNNFYLNNMQYVLDYIIPALAIGLAGIYHAIPKKIFIYIGVLLMMVIKYLSVLISGAYYWMPEGAAAGSKLAWLNSFSYNTGYNLATLILLIVVLISFENLFKKKIF